MRYSRLITIKYLKFTYNFASMCLKKTLQHCFLLYGSHECFTVQTGWLWETRDQPVYKANRQMKHHEALGWKRGEMSSHLCARKEVRVSLDSGNDLTQDYSIGKYISLKIERGKNEHTHTYSKRFSSSIVCCRFLKTETYLAYCEVFFFIIF